MLFLGTGVSLHAAQKTESEWQQEAIRRFPDLGVPGSKLNKAFVAEYRRLKQNPDEKDFFRRPIWPLLLAEKCSYALMKAESKAQDSPLLPKESAFTRPAKAAPSASNQNQAIMELADRGELHVQNNTSRGARVKLVRNNQIVSSFFVSPSGSGEVGSLADGYYSLLYSLGNSYFRFNQTLQFSTTHRYGPQGQLQAQFNTYTLTLDEVIGGNASASPISEAEFKQY